MKAVNANKNKRNFVVVRPPSMPPHLKHGVVFKRADLEGMVERLTDAAASPVMRELARAIQAELEKTEEQS